MKIEDHVRIYESIFDLIKNKAVVSVRFREQLYGCDVHHYYFPGYPNRISASNAILPEACNFNHLICTECVKLYISNAFQTYGLNNYYECPRCIQLGCPESLLLNQQGFIPTLNFAVGENTINELMLSLNVQKRPVAKNPLYVLSNLVPRYAFLII